MPTTRLQEFLEANHVKYSLIPHEATFTAQQSAASSHVSPQQLAKTVIIKLDGDLAMAVIPANTHVSLAALRDQTGAETVELANEFEFKDAFPDCEIGAMPPFGNLYGMAVFVDEELAKDKEIAFNAGSHDQLARMAYADFAKLVTPKVLELVAHRELTVPKSPVPLW